MSATSIFDEEDEVDDDDDDGGDDSDEVARTEDPFTGAAAWIFPPWGNALGAAAAVKTAGEPKAWTKVGVDVAATEDLAGDMDAAEA